MSELGLGKRVDLDIPIGIIEEGMLKVTVSARGKQAVYSFFNKKAGRGFEVGFSPAKLEELNDMGVKAVKRVRGVAHGA